MRVLIIRHAIAEDRETFAKTGRDDFERALTKEGRSRMRAGAEGLRRVVKRLDVLAASGATRAVETAKIVAKAYDGMRIAKVAALESGKPAKGVLKWLQGQPADATIALVGHEPQLGMLVSWLLAGEQRSFVRLRKGSACLLEFPGAVKAGRATLLWVMTPGQLRELRG